MPATAGRSPLAGNRAGTEAELIDETSGVGESMPMARRATMLLGGHPRDSGAADFANNRLEWRRLIAEAGGTFLLVLVAAGADIVDAVSHGQAGRTAAVTGPIDLPYGSRGTLELWRKWSFSYDSHGPQVNGDDPAPEWVVVHKNRISAWFPLASGDAGKPGDHQAAETGCAVELTEIGVGTAQYVSVRFEACGAPGCCARRLSTPLSSYSLCRPRPTRDSASAWKTPGLTPNGWQGSARPATAYARSSAARTFRGSLCPASGACGWAV